MTHKGSGQVAAACVDLLRSLSQSAKLVALYTASHPVTSASLQAGWTRLQHLREGAGWTDVTIDAAEGRWIVNGVTTAVDGPGIGALSAAFHAWSLRRLAFLEGIRPADLNAVCQLVGSVPTQHARADALSFLGQRGALHVAVNGAELVARALKADPAAEAIADKPMLENLAELQGSISSAAETSLSPARDEEGSVAGACAVLPAAAKYEETMRMQRDFISHVAHELKAPLTSICSALELVTDKVGPRMRAEERKLLEISLRNGRQLWRIIDDILDFSKLESGKMSAALGTVPAAAILREAVDGMRPWAAAKNISLETEGDALAEGGCRVLADHQRIVQVLNNLISNAIKSTPEGGRILVSGTGRDPSRPDQVVFCVRDNGCGIAREDQKKIFQRFVQLAAGEGHREGVGLGLAIVRQLIDLHAGSLWLESEPGKGSAFFFSLPVPLT